MGSFDKKYCDNYGEKEVVVSEKPYPFVSVDALGELSLLPSVSGRASYIVKDAALYNTWSAAGDEKLQLAITGVILKMFSDLKNQGINAMGLVTNPGILNNNFLPALNNDAFADSLGIDFISAVLMVSFSDIDREFIKQRSKLLAANITTTTPNQTAAASIMAAQAIANAALAQTATATKQWTCPCCNGTNDGGNFCEFCGEKRA